MIRAYPWSIVVFKVMCAVGVAVLVLYCALMAFAPKALLSLAIDDDITLGPITREQWEAHLQAHLQRAREYLAGLQAPVGDGDAVSAQIYDLPDVSLSAQFVFALVLALPLAFRGMGELLPVRALVLHIYPIDLSPEYSVPHLPP